MKVPILKINKNTRPIIENENPVKKDEDADFKNRLIHAFDPQNLSMPKYSSKYQNEHNVGAVRHLLGGR